MLEQELINYTTKGGAIFYYKGTFYDKPSLSISEIVEQNLTSKLPKKLLHRTLFLLIEVLQNIEKYSAHHPVYNDSFCLENNNNVLFIEASNVVENTNLKKLKLHLEQVSKSNIDELNELFRATLTKSIEVKQKSPGLGLIEMKRKNKKAYQFSFDELDENFTRFNLLLTIDIEVNQPHLMDLDGSKIKQIFSKKNEVIAFAGNFDNSSVSQFLRLVNYSKFSSNQTLNSKYHHVIIEMVQNAKKHGAKNTFGKSGFFIIENFKENISVACCNYVDKKNAINEQISDLNALSDKKLNQYSSQVMLDENIDGGLGLIQIAKYLRPSPISSKSFYDSNNEHFCYLEGQFSKKEFDKQYSHIKKVERNT